MPYDPFQQCICVQCSLIINTCILKEQTNKIKKNKVMKTSSGSEERPAVSSFCLTQNITSVLKLHAEKKTPDFYTRFFTIHNSHIPSSVIVYLLSCFYKVKYSIAFGFRATLKFMTIVKSISHSICPQNFKL